MLLKTIAAISEAAAGTADPPAPRWLASWTFEIVVIVLGDFNVYGHRMAPSGHQSHVAPARLFVFLFHRGLPFMTKINVSEVRWTKVWPFMTPGHAASKTNSGVEMLGLGPSPPIRGAGWR